MGHERVGILPRTERWCEIVAKLRLALEGSPDDTATLASGILSQVRSRYQRVHQDSGVQAAFAYLVALATSELPAQGGLTGLDTKLGENPSAIRLAAELGKWVTLHRGAPEYAELACRAAADTIARWSKERSGQTLLFDEARSPANIWGNIDGRAFCRIARTFFGQLTERYLRYFIERSASGEAPSLNARGDFNELLSTHVAKIARHAFETARITESFAAGWFNKHACSQRPSDGEVARFLAVAFGKLQEELAREGSHT